ncbi:MAG: metalloregulator ArsR/SmtB family transcription factor [Gemmataceae bacterium]|nr:metalloregulator ArsR/SmtB family transcription factor [Gemmataceae bacterium]
MARAQTTLDSFNAIAEHKRRLVLEKLADGERPVNDLVHALGWPQPQVSKHLGVLKKVGLVNERRVGRQRVYRMNADRLKPVYEWVKSFERFWQHQLDRIKERAERKAKEKSH